MPERAAINPTEGPCASTSQRRNTRRDQLDLSSCTSLESTGRDFAARCAFRRITASSTIPLAVIDANFAFESRVLEVDLRHCARLTAVGAGFCAGAVLLKHVHLPTGVVSIGDDFCRGSLSLEAIDITQHTHLVSIGDGFCAGSGVRRVAINAPPSARLTIGADFLARAWRLTDCEVQAKTLGARAVSYCSALRWVSLKGVAVIGDGFAFTSKAPRWVDCLHCSFTSTGKDFLANSNAVDVLLPQSLTELGDGFGAYSAGVTRVDFPPSITTIGNDVLRGAKALRVVSLPRTVAAIGDRFAMDAASLSQFEADLRLRDGASVSIGADFLRNTRALASAEFRGHSLTFDLEEAGFCRGSGVQRVTLGTSETTARIAVRGPAGERRVQEVMHTARFAQGRIKGLPLGGRAVLGPSSFRRIAEKGRVVPFVADLFRTFGNECAREVRSLLLEADDAEAIFRVACIVLGSPSLACIFNEAFSSLALRRLGEYVHPSHVVAGRSPLPGLGADKDLTLLHWVVALCPDRAALCWGKSSPSAAELANRTAFGYTVVHYAAMMPDQQHLAWRLLEHVDKTPAAIAQFESQRPRIAHAAVSDAEACAAVPPLFLAVAFGNIDFSVELAKRGADANATITPELAISLAKTFRCPWLPAASELARQPRHLSAYDLVLLRWSATGCLIQYGSVVATTRGSNAAADKKAAAQCFRAISEFEASAEKFAPAGRKKRVFECHFDVVPVLPGLPAFLGFVVWLALLFTVIDPPVPRAVLTRTRSLVKACLPPFADHSSMITRMLDESEPWCVSDPAAPRIIEFDAEILTASGRLRRATVPVPPPTARDPPLPELAGSHVTRARFVSDGGAAGGDGSDPLDRHYAVLTELFVSDNREWSNSLHTAGYSSRFKDAILDRQLPQRVVLVDPDAWRAAYWPGLIATALLVVAAVMQCTFAGRQVRRWRSSVGMLEPLAGDVARADVTHAVMAAVVAATSAWVVAVGLERVAARLDSWTVDTATSSAADDVNTVRLAACAVTVGAFALFTGRAVVYLPPLRNRAGTKNAVRCAAVLLALVTDPLVWVAWYLVSLFALPDPCRHARNRIRRQGWVNHLQRRPGSLLLAAFGANARWPCSQQLLVYRLSVGALAVTIGWALVVIVAYGCVFDAQPEFLQSIVRVLPSVLWFLDTQRTALPEALGLA